MGITTLQRRDFMRAVIARAQDDRDAVSPWRGLVAAGAAGQLGQYFDDEADLLMELHREWLRLLVGRLHHGEIVARRTVAEVRDLYDAVCADQPTLRRILDNHRADPALWEPVAREHAMLARIAGLAPEGTPHAEAAELGRALVTQRIPVQRSAVA
jgi:hypothetical protein